MVFFEKSQPSPACLEAEKLKANGVYNCEDVLIRIRDDFKNKCYICEERAPSNINIEHFQPHRNSNIDLKFDWNNLFYACAHCNLIKSDRPEFDNILNCTLISDNVEMKIKHRINPCPVERPIFTAVENSEAITSTILLLNEVYNGTTITKKLESSNLREKLLDEMINFHNLLFEYHKNRYERNEKEKIKNKILTELRTSSSFTAFKRWLLRDHEIFSIEFAENL